MIGVWKEGLFKFGVGAPHIADEELYLQAFFLPNVPPIISQMALGPIRENVEIRRFFDINRMHGYLPVKLLPLNRVESFVKLVRRR